MTTIVLARSAGQLGNQLFLHAEVLAFAMEHDLKFANPALGAYGAWFPAFAGDPFCRWPRPRRRLPAVISGVPSRRVLAGLVARGVERSARLPGIDAIVLADGEELDLSTPAFFERARRARLMALGGWLLRDSPALARHRDAVVAELTPGSDVRAEATAAVERARRGGSGPLIGLHVRRGDYAGWGGGRFHFGLREYRAAAERALETWGPGATLLVCGDQEVDLTAFAGLAATTGPGSVLGDLTALSLCDALVGPPSTFSGWASFSGRVPLFVLRDPSAPIERAAFRISSP